MPDEEFSRCPECRIPHLFKCKEYPELCFMCCKRKREEERDAEGELE